MVGCEIAGRATGPAQIYKIAHRKKIFAQVYEDRVERLYGFFRPYVQKVVHRYLYCGDLRNGFAPVKCTECIY